MAQDTEWLAPSPTPAFRLSPSFILTLESEGGGLSSGEEWAAARSQGEDSGRKEGALYSRSKGDLHPDINPGRPGHGGQRQCTSLLPDTPSGCRG